VAIKTITGANATSTDKIPFRIGNTKRELTAALSVTVNAGANVFNAGSVELAAKNIDFFVYIGWKAATSSMFVVISRMAHARTFGDFSGTNTSERYGANSGTAPASTDQVEVIGRFRAQNSGSASYNWSIPSAVVMSRPIDETDWLDWQPVYSAGGSMTFTTVTTNIASYKIRRDAIEIVLDASGTTGGSASTELRATVPFNSTFAAAHALGGFVHDATPIGGFAFMQFGTPDFVGARRHDNANFGLGATRLLRVHGTYKIG
jgi:hypothetical protein